MIGGAFLVVLPFHFALRPELPDSTNARKA
jgi:hypothetical protein